jgi:tetratricopeptide (TPR) repeat protein
VTVGYTLTHARRYDEAIAELKKVIQLDENNAAAHRWLSAAYSGKGSHSEALAAYLTAIRLGDVGPSGQIYLGAAYARVGDHDKARAILKQLETGEVFVSPGELPVLYVALDEYEKAFASFEKAYAAHDLQLQFLKIDPSFDRLRGDARFQGLVHRLGFPE